MALKTKMASPLLGKAQVASGGAPDEPSEEDLHRDGIKAEMRAATRDWVGGRISTKKHEQIHARGRKALKESRK